jgi:uncharacterized protein YdeI (YjbR/CyaY-like superfamily)
MEHLIPEVRKINDQAVTLSGAVSEVQDNIRRINFGKLSQVTERLETISKLLAEVIED